MGFAPEGAFQNFSVPFTRQFISLTNDSIQIIPVKLPGRESLLKYQPLTDIPSLVNFLFDNYKDVFQPPFVLFGHSMGALLAFELSRELRRQQLPLPDHLFVSAKQAPQIPEREQHLHTLSDDDFMQEILKKQGTPEEVLTQPELLQLILPALRADITICETYNFQEEEPFSFPITAFAGLYDPYVNETELKSWQSHTTSSFSWHFYPGDHFFIHSFEEKIVQEIESRLSSSQKQHSIG